MKRAFFVLSILACMAQSMATAELTLVQNRKPAAVIVVAQNPSPAAQVGAKLLSDFVFKMSGARLTVIKESALSTSRIVDGKIETDSKGAAKNFVLVGESTLAKNLGAVANGLGPGGILLRTRPNALVLLGADTKTPDDPGGSRYAVTTFLDDVLGCRYLWPGESGLVVPERATVTVPDLDQSFTPVIVERHIRSNEYGDRIQTGLNALLLDKAAWARSRTITTPDWFQWQRMGGTLGLKAGDGSIIPPEAWRRFLHEHPEWFAMQADGSREPAPGEERLRLCKSNLGLIEAIAQEKIKELRAHPDLKCVSLITHDGGRTGFCLCPECKALDAPEGRPTDMWTWNHQAAKMEWLKYISLSDRMAWFENQIAERVSREFPNVLFCGSAYSCYTAPPLHVKLNPHVVIRYAGMDYTSDVARRQGLEEWDGWVKAASMVQFRPNFLLTGRKEGIPALYVHKLAEDIRHMASRGLVGTDFDACMHHWATQGLNYYVLAKLLWNPNLDVDHTIDTYCQSGFGPGWKDVEKYFAREEQLMNQTAAENYAGGPETPQGYITMPYTPEVLAELKGYLDAAERAAGDDAAVRRRIAFLRRGLELTEIQAAAHRFLRRANELNADEKAEASRLLDRRWIVMRKIFAEEPWAVNVASILQAEGGRFAPLGWKGPSPALRSAEGARE